MPDPSGLSANNFRRKLGIKEMPIEALFKRVKDPADPHRCQAIGGNGQCPFEAVYDPETEIWHRNCPRHSNNKSREAVETKSTRRYMAAKWQERIAQQLNIPETKSLRDELAVLRMTLDITLNKCKDEDELVMRSQALIDLGREIGKLVKTVHGVERDSGQYLTKEDALQLVNEWATIIANYIPDPDILGFLAEDLVVPLNRMLPDAQSQSPTRRKAVTNTGPKDGINHVSVGAAVYPPT